MSADDMRALQKLSTAKAPKEGQEILAPLTTLCAQLIATPVADRAKLVTPDAERLAIAALLWRCTPLMLTLAPNDPLKSSEEALDAALAIVRFGSAKVQERFLREIVANAGHTGLMRDLVPIVDATPLVVSVFEALIKGGNELHVFNLIAFLAEARARGSSIPMSLMVAAQTKAAAAKIALVRSEAANPY